MSGMWHADAEFSSESKLRKVPSLGYISHALLRCVCKPSKNDLGYSLVASAGGHLIFERASNYSWGVSDHSTECNDRNKFQSSLIVTNSVMKQF